MKKFIAAVIVLVALIAVLVVIVVRQARPSTGDVQVKNETVTLRVGEKAEVAPEYDFRLMEVTQDFRCPINAECIEWGGIAVALMVRYENDLVEPAYITSDSVASNIFGYVIGITDIQPPMETGKTISPEEYQVTFSVEKADENSPRQQISLKSDKGVDIILHEPFPFEKISSPLHLEGMAPGNWFFEASAPIILTDWDGKIIAEKYITAEGEWMTTNMVPFSGELTFEKPGYGERGFLIFRKDNASGLPEHDDALQITVLFE